MDSKQSGCWWWIEQVTCLAKHAGQGTGYGAHEAWKKQDAGEFSSDEFKLISYKVVTFYLFFHHRLSGLVEIWYENYTYIGNWLKWSSEHGAARPLSCML